MYRSVLVVCVLAMTAAACGGYGTSPSPTVTPISAGPTTVLIPSGASTGTQPGFTPPTLTVAAGTTVTFGNNDGTTHTTTADAGQWNSNNVTPGTTFTVKMDTAGTYKYHCTIHPFMTGTVVVQ